MIKMREVNKQQMAERTKLYNDELSNLFTKATQDVQTGNRHDYTFGKDLFCLQPLDRSC